MALNPNPEWITRGKTIRALIEELSRVGDQDLEVRISLDGGDTHKCISLVGKIDGKFVLMNCEGEGITN